ncbi:site-specific integrase [Flavonifractor sp. An82]|uniref:site-specific integrase n=1 Tax=Flavonifractor sp. An82 TaxID=1965660 RepID=UPI000B37795E|nr:site-specific integrase [Flavonifractor sp. An82]OUN22463.1 site-specific integrase [Flavonifractor sp. An82]
MKNSKSSRNAPGAGTIRKKVVRRGGKEYSYWEARYTVGYDPGTGKQLQRSITAKTQREAAQKLRQVTLKLDQGTYHAPCKLTVAQWLDMWAADYLGDVKRSTAHLYRENIRLYLKPALGAVRLEALTTPAIQKIYNRLVSTERDGQGLSPKTVKNIHGVLHQALQQAVAIGYLRFNPAAACTLPRIVKKQIKPLEEDQIARFLEAIQGHRHEILYKVALFTGMREGEVLGLMWDCVDFEHNTITVDKQLRRAQEKGGEYYLAPPKNNKARVITVAPSVIKLLRVQQRRQAEQRLALGPVWKGSGLVFTNELGDRLSYRTVYDCFKRIAASIGCPKARFHDLRHTYAVMALESGDDIKTVQENLGHHAASFTLDVYGHITERMRRQSAERMERLIQTVSGG